MKTHEPELIRTVDELNDRNKRVRQLEVYSYGIWEELGIREVIL